MMRRVGFVGLGFMGRGMAANLAKGLPQLTVFDISKENVKLFENSLGREDLSKVNISQSVKSLAEQSDMICLSLPSESACREVIFGPDGIAQAWKSNRGLIVDHCTSSKDFATQISSELQKSHQNIQYLDCPVSGGPTGAKNATLSIMVGGTVENFDLCRPILDLIGKNVQHFGPVGSGMAAKLVNNALVTAHAQCAVEALLMAERLGLIESTDQIQTLTEMLKTSWGQSKVFELVASDYISSITNNHDRSALRSFPTQAPLRNLQKDMDCVIHDLKNTFGEPSDSIVRRSFPIFQTTYDCLDRACSEDNYGLANSPFAALLIPIHEEATKSSPH